ncbi:dUTP diphosphatase [Candidatus Marinimicrobia bacterium]|nr:dUTP diphosphatase [Candidatus Neomarinimicrobiota bacterium]
MWIPPKNADTVIKVKKLTSTATIPTKSRKTDAGYDLYSDEDIALYPEDTKLISTGIAFAIPDGYAGLIWDRSGLGTKGIHRHAGVVDSSYRGEVKVALYNARPGHVDFTDNMYFISRGDRIAQILFQKVPHFDLVETEELDDTDRGSSGFGSSGK